MAKLPTANSNEKRNSKIFVKGDEIKKISFSKINEKREVANSIAFTKAKN